MFKDNDDLEHDNIYHLLLPFNQGQDQNPNEKIKMLIRMMVNHQLLRMPKKNILKMYFSYPDPGPDTNHTKQSRGQNLLFYAE